MNQLFLSILFNSCKWQLRKTRKLILSVVWYKINECEVIADHPLEVFVVYFIPFSWAKFEIFVEFENVCWSSTLLWGWLFFLFRFAVLLIFVRKYAILHTILSEIYYLAKPVSARYLSDFRFVAVYVPSQFTSIANDHIFTIRLLSTLLTSDIFNTLWPVDALFQVNKMKHKRCWRPKNKIIDDKIGGILTELTIAKFPNASFDCYKLPSIYHSFLAC